MSLSGSSWIKNSDRPADADTTMFIKVASGSKVDLGRTGNDVNSNGDVQENSALINNKTWRTKGSDVTQDGVTYHSYSYTENGVTLTVNIQDGVSVI